MGKADKTQSKLHFEQGKTPRFRDGNTENTRSTSGDPDSDVEPDLKHILLAMHQSLATIDCKIDSLSFRVDKITERLDKHAELFNAPERRISKVKDDIVTVATSQSTIDKILVALQTKVEDLEPIPTGTTDIG
ncbi:hypothetical protein NDU88_004633 [Pleurodeles waltl]|uniref:Uncharacterized protein n=1 Tax=Pleurodeles waltl TaxID=8319 RepID=A0AAV7NK80_PLEWA|nr:hypothetical protein NDU88_004633 [Pleurodeles waltl]